MSSTLELAALIAAVGYALPRMVALLAGWLAAIARRVAGWRRVEPKVSGAAFLKQIAEQATTIKKLQKEVSELKAPKDGGIA